MDKTSVSKRILHFRKIKGITQEALAEATGLNVRTIQRIEAGEVDPRLYTLKTIAEALSVNIEELLPEPGQHELNQLAILHITPLGFFLLPIVGNVLFPFIFWMLKREEFSSLDRHGKNILNAQITYSIVAGIITGIHTVFAFIAILAPRYTRYTMGYFTKLPMILLVGLSLCMIFFLIIPVINAFRVYKGKEPWKYPLRIRFFK